MSQHTHYDPTESEQKKLDSGRLMRAEADVIMPLLLQQREAAVQRLIMHFRAGELDGRLAAAAAEISALETTTQTIRTRIKQAEVIERRIHES